MYEDRFWKKNWDQGVDDLDPNLFETTFVNIIEKAFQDVQDKTAMGFLGVDVTFGELNRYANQFANMLIENDFKKGDVVGINLPNIPQYVTGITVLDYHKDVFAGYGSEMVLENIIGKGKLLELYGMTETSPVSTMNPSKGKKKLGTVGMPFLNTYIKLVDPASEEDVPLGEPGEMCVKGPLVMKGYFNKPEATAQAVDGNGYMHTGDVGIMDEEGYIKIVDRTKDMIIVGGFKVFSSKVEDILSQHPAISILALIGVENPDRPGSELVKAYIQLTPKAMKDKGEDALKEDIITFAKDKCSPYEIPKLIEFMDEIPLTAVGKINKKVLRR